MISGNCACSARMMPAVSSTDSVVCVTKPRARGIGRLERRDIGLGLDQRHRALRQLAHRADHLGMAGMADQQHMAAEPLVAHRLLVHLGDQRAGRVEIEQIARLRIRRHRFRHAMRGKHHRALAVLGRDFVELLDEHRAQFLQPFDDIAIVHDLVADIDRRAVFLQRQHDDLDGAVDAGAEAARLAEPDRQRRFVERLEHRFRQCWSWRRNEGPAPCPVKSALASPHARHSQTPSTPASAAASPYQVTAYCR